MTGGVSRCGVLASNLRLGVVVGGWVSVVVGGSVVGTLVVGGGSVTENKCKRFCQLVNRFGCLVYNLSRMTFPSSSSS